MKELEELKTIVQKNLAPTFQKLPADLISRSHTQEDVHEDRLRQGYFSEAGKRDFEMGRAAVKWAETVEPLAVLTWKDYHETPDLIEKAKRLLSKKGVQASVIMCDPDFAYDLIGDPHGRTDMPKVGDGLEFMGLKFFRNLAMSYNWGMYIFDNRDARVYLKGKSKHYWNIPPYVVHITRGVDANPTDSLTWFHEPR
ncbi:MAG: hypothetical protein IIZ04_03135 [Aeriscardovia sp.]|nr:hypothetical protein [Aeriscardovia sp.]